MMTIRSAMAAFYFRRFRSGFLSGAVLFCLASVGQAFAMDQSSSIPKKDPASIAEARRVAELLRSQITRCWMPPPGASESGVKVTLLVKLNQDGTLNGEPTVDPGIKVTVSVTRDGTLVGKPVIEKLPDSSNAMAQLIARSAIRAVKTCALGQPYKMPADQFAIWSTSHITFDPSGP